MRAYSSIALLLVIGGAVPVAGCHGAVGNSASSSGTAGSTGSAPDSGARGRDGAEGGASVPLPGGGAFAPGPAGWRRLTAAQYWNAIDDLLGAGAPRSPLDPDQQNAGFDAVGASVVATSPNGVSQYETAALGVSAWAFADPARRAALVACAGGAAPDKACAQSFITRLLTMAFRRSATASETTRFMALVTGAADLWTGMQQAVAAILQSPKFLYRIEIGVPVAGMTGVDRLGGYELASRLSFMLWNAPPDQALLTAAQQGTLDNAAGVAAQVTRMLSAPRAHAGVRDFFSEALSLTDMGVLSDPALADDMRQETMLLVDDIVFARNADLQELLSSTSTFLDQRLATHYGLPAPATTGFSRVTLPSDSMRVGFLGQGAFLVASSSLNHPSATLRGKFVRESLLCQDVPPPPPDVNTNLPVPSATMPMTTRQQLTMHRADAACAACHAFMDPIGLAFDNFDWDGKYRTQEFGLPIDPSGDLDGQPFANARELAGLLAKREEVSACTARKMYRVAVGHQESPGEEPAITNLAKNFTTSGHKFSALVASLATSDAFRLVASSP